MKLAEALILRSDLNKKIQSLKERLGRYSVVQQGDNPHEDPEDVYRQASGVTDSLKDLIIKIEASNQIAKIKDGRTIAVALAERDNLIIKHALVNSAIDGTKKEPDRYGVKEIKWVSTISVKDYQKRMDDYSKSIRDINVMIQEANWLYEL